MPRMTPAMGFGLQAQPHLFQGYNQDAVWREVSLEICAGPAEKIPL